MTWRGVHAAARNTDFLQPHGGFYRIGEGCRSSPQAAIFDREYVSIGNNADCFIVGHDGMINKAYAVKLAKVSRVDIRDNVIIGSGAKVLPGLTIGPNAIVRAGSVVGCDVLPNTVVRGVPVGRLDLLVRALHLNETNGTSARWPSR